jgi:hypothetical protein
MAKILSEGDVSPIGRTNKAYWSFKLCTKKRADELNCNVISPSNATDNQFIYEVTKAHDYVLYGPTSIVWSGTGYSFTIVSSKDGSWLQPSVHSKSTFITSVSISQTSGGRGTVILSFGSLPNNSSQNGYIRFIQPESEFLYTLLIYPTPPQESLYVNLTWRGSTMTFGTGSIIVTAYVHLLDNSDSALFNGYVRFNSGNPIQSLDAGMDAKGNITHTENRNTVIYKVTVSLSYGNTFYSQTLTLPTPIRSNGFLYLSLYDDGMIQKT